LRFFFSKRLTPGLATTLKSCPLLSRKRSKMRNRCQEEGCEISIGAGEFSACCGTEYATGAASIAVFTEAGLGLCRHWHR
jgi:hypothetical protein